MSKRFPKARYPLPLTVNPGETVCFQVNVPNDPNHIAAFMGEIYALGRAYSWADDPDHTALSVARVWMDIFNNLKKCKLAPGADGFAGADGGDELLIRQNPDNPCEIQSSADGSHWCTFIDLSLCVPKITQPGNGTQQPAPGGGEACYHANLQASGKWLLPTLVNTGDVIDITAYNGATNDGASIAWRCPDGDTFFGGICIAGIALDGADPLPTDAHQSVIAKIGSTFYPVLLSSPFTVPGGVSSEQVIFQINDSDLSDNSGSIDFDVCVTNNQASAFQHTQNFAVNPGLFGLCSPTNNGIYTPGTGFEAALWGPDGFGHYHREICITAAFSARTLTRIAFKGNLTRGSTIASGVVCVGINDAGGAQLLITHAAAVDGSNQTWEWTGSGSFSTVGIFIETGVDNSDPGGSALVLQAIIEGLGSDPF
jgi:hypothetical protein